jgi:uncharacterized protein YjbI with pentapeptide repeats
MSGVKLTGADLRFIKGNGVWFPGANLTGADLTGADLLDANLTNADLTEANLTSANLQYTQVSGATTLNTGWHSTTCPDGTNSDYDGNTCVGHGF